jgi:hypothetical protein
MPVHLLLPIPKKRHADQTKIHRKRRILPSAPRKPKYAPVTLSEQDGVRYLHFGTEWVQGAMRIRKPNWPELEYAQQMMAWMLWLEQPAASPSWAWARPR